MLFRVHGTHESQTVQLKTSEPSRPAPNGRFLIKSRMFGLHRRYGLNYSLSFYVDTSVSSEFCVRMPSVRTALELCGRRAIFLMALANNPDARLKKP